MLCCVVLCSSLPSPNLNTRMCADTRAQCPPSTQPPYHHPHPASPHPSSTPTPISAGLSDPSSKVQVAATNMLNLALSTPSPTSGPNSTSISTSSSAAG